MVDATVLFAGTAWPRWSHAVLRHAALGNFQLVLSALVITQARRNLQKRLPAYVEPFEEWLQWCPFEAAPDPTLEEVANHKTLMRDAKDIPVALAAINAGVDYFVSEDKDFTDEDDTTREVRQRLKIMRPVIFLREVMGWSSADLEKIHFRDWPLEEA
jgi:predicted nucleic acid-binding protein